jgi:hypothetical protein
MQQKPEQEKALALSTSRFIHYNNIIRNYDAQKSL